MATYTVVSGDTLNKIAARNGMTLSQLLALNPQITNPDLIRPGQVVNTTATSTPPTTTSTSNTSTYSVVKGDTLNKIAAANGLTLSQLLEVNPQITNPDLILIGQVVNLPGAGGGGGGGTTAPGGSVLDPSQGVTDVAPVAVGSSTIPQGGQLIRVTSPAGSDEEFLYYIVYDWRDISLAYEVGGQARFAELFGSTDNFGSFNTVSQEAFDANDYVLAGSIDSELGATESIGSRIEREIRALGMEDLPSWLSGSPDALAIVATATAEEWSSGRLWQELSGTQAFQSRFGGALDLYLQSNVTIADAVDQLVADENALLAAIRPWAAGELPTTDYLHGLLNVGWTAGAVAQVLEQAEVLRRDPNSLATSNFILEASGLAPLDEVGFINALTGYGPQDTIEALNTATAARALEEAGIDLDDSDLDLIMGLVDTSDRLLTADSWRNLSQELSFNMIRFSREIDQSRFGIDEDDLIAAAFGREAPSGKSSGEVMGLLARFERDRQAAAGGFDASSGFIDASGRLRIQGLTGL